MRWPLGAEMSPRSSRICMTIAVEVSTKPAPATNDDRHRKAADHADAASAARADADLQRAEPEDLAPQAPQPRRLHLQPDDEEEHHDAEFGDVQDGLRVGEDCRGRTGR